MKLIFFYIIGFIYAVASTYTFSICHMISSLLLIISCAINEPNKDS